MRKSFSFVFMGALGFTAAVGASSFSSSITLKLQNSGINEVIKGIGSEGFKFSGDGASFVDRGGGNIAVAVPTTIGPFDDDEKRVGRTAARIGPPSLENPFFSIETDAFEAFEFVSAKLGSNVFDSTQTGFLAASFAQTAGTEEVFPSYVKSRALGAKDSGLAGKPLTSLELPVSSGASAVPIVFSGEGPTLAELLVDDVELLTTTAVPIPASALLLATAILGAGAFARRKTQS